MIASLSMYDWPGARAANDAYWSATARHLRGAGVDAPGALCRGGDMRATWQAPDLLLGQTCGMPYVSGHCGDAVIVARPDYGLSGARDGTYRSAIVAGLAAPDTLLEMEGSRVALNEWPSYSGHIALRAHLAGFRPDADTPFFGQAILSGGHLFSARMVAAGDADVAALDWVSWEMLLIHEPDVARALKLIGQTDPAPALPFITAPGMVGFSGALVLALDTAAREVAHSVGVPCAVMPAGDGDYNATRAAATRAMGERFAPAAPKPVIAA